MWRNSSPPPDVEDKAASANAGNHNHVKDNDLGFQSIRDRFPFKRNPGHNRDRGKASWDRPSLRKSHHPRFNRKGLLSLFPFRGAYLFYFLIFFTVFAFAMASMVLQSSITIVFRQGPSERHRSIRQGGFLRFVPSRVLKSLLDGEGLDRERLQTGMALPTKIGLRKPRLALVLGNLKKDPRSLTLITLMKSLQKLDYALEIYIEEEGKAGSSWQQIGFQVSVLGPEQYSHIDWSIFEGVLVNSLEAKDAISSLMQEPFCSVPLIWIIREDTLSNRLPVYKEMGWDNLVSHWRKAFSRASVVVFPDFTLPMLYSMLDSGNFFVNPGSPVDVWAAESYNRTHDKYQMRKENGFNDEDLVVLVVGSPFFYNDQSWDYSVVMSTIRPLLIKYATNDAGGSFKFVFLCGNATDEHALQEDVSRLGLPPGYVKHYALNSDVNSVLLMGDIVVYGSSQDEQGFPPLIIRAMTFGIPVVAPDNPIIKKIVVDRVDGILFPKHDTGSLMMAFSLLISNGKLSKFALKVASSGRLLAKNVLASECVTTYARLLENVLCFPSSVFLPGPISQLQKKEWEWDLFDEIEEGTDDEEDFSRESSVVYALEEELSDLVNPINSSENGSETVVQDIPTEEDWEVLKEVESYEEYERLEMEQLEERKDKSPGIWDDIYRDVRKSEKLKFEANERDEGELERTGQPVCIYEIYDGAGAWPFLHHGSLYRGLSLNTGARRSRSDDVDAVARLPLLNDTFYRDMICEMGGMFSIANKVDTIHRRPWIGFQSWHAAGRKVSLSIKAEKVLEEKIQKETIGDVIYVWSRMDMVHGVAESAELTFWSMCDVLNGGHCRTAFEDAFRKMYGLPSDVEALPPMPQDGGHWSALHSWLMPTPSFLEFIMFSRMFVDSLDALHSNSSEGRMCLLGSSDLEKNHCYCRLLEFLVNVWAYHSARKMVYVDPNSGFLEEQHPIEQRKGFMWAKYFNLALLKSMDEDLAEAADDNDHPREKWLWPLTGEVHWQGIYDRERAERYRVKMDKKRKTKEKLRERLLSGYRQKPLGRR
ncbi:hypothetical protein HS088_TW09G00632 [Tripterygium wilfordii]|uniref:Glycosyl transferase family 1 domain-containing protein n=1 Tax=Tripterygium wilfordii TaxID=458696 RepID=A0A7J7D8E2_TRIWF|nr:uncharacterized protein LOC120005391 isoform X2 [Tripterygium wilfordii]KAF5742581.1 hypothetical protein HS088_TW09G00632 [Tripterygium wilfordii]